MAPQARSAAPYFPWAILYLGGGSAILAQPKQQAVHSEQGCGGETCWESEFPFVTLVPP